MNYNSYIQCKGSWVLNQKIWEWIKKIASKCWWCKKSWCWCKMSGWWCKKFGWLYRKSGWWFKKLRWWCKKFWCHLLGIHFKKWLSNKRRFFKMNSLLLGVVFNLRIWLLSLKILLIGFEDFVDWSHHISITSHRQKILE